MKDLYCWRCRAIVPMLDDEEFVEIRQLYRQGTLSAKEERQNRRGSLAEVDLWDLFRPVREAYSRKTGYREIDHNQVMHHRTSLYGIR